MYASTATAPNKTAEKLKQFNGSIRSIRQEIKTKPWNKGKLPVQKDQIEVQAQLAVSHESPLKCSHQGSKAMSSSDYFGDVSSSASNRSTNTKSAGSVKVAPAAVRFVAPRNYTNLDDLMESAPPTMGTRKRKTRLKKMVKRVSKSNPKIANPDAEEKYSNSSDENSN